MAEAIAGKEPLDGYDFAAVEGLDLNELNRDRGKLEQQLTDVKNQLAAAQAEPQRRFERVAQIPDELAAAQKELKKIEAELKKTDADEESDQ